MTDPYQVLGISRSASDDEIKKQYRALSRKLHPDANVNNPDKAQAEEKFKQVQQAYDQIMKERQQGYSDSGSYGSAGGYGDFGSAFGGFGFGGFGASQGSGRSAQSSPRMQAAASYIRNRHFAEALHVLEDIPFSERQAQWYYYSAMANQGVGNNSTALDQIRHAVQLEPSNTQYRQFQQHLEYGGTWYTGRSESYDRPYSGYNGSCLSLMMEMLLCSCCCGGPC